MKSSAHFRFDLLPYWILLILAALAFNLLMFRFVIFIISLL